MQAGLLWTGGKPPRSDFSGGADSRRDNTIRESQQLRMARVVGVVDAGGGGQRERENGQLAAPYLYIPTTVTTAFGEYCLDSQSND
jgi:hypothetical protein